MLRYKTISITTGSTGEQLTNAITGLGEGTRTIKELRYRNVRINTSAANAIDAVKARAYVNQDQVLDAHLGSFTSGLASATTMLYSEGLFKLDVELKPGDVFQVGANFGSTADYPQCTMVYEDK